MTFALITLVPVFLVVLWAFFRLSPQVHERRMITRFNLGVLIFGLAVCGIAIIKIYSDMSAGPDRAWWPIISMLYSLVLFTLVMVIGGVVRNFVVFRTGKSRRDA